MSTDLERDWHNDEAADCRDEKDRAPSPRSASEARDRLVDLVRSYINDPYHLHIGFVENSKDLLAEIDAERNRPYDLLPDSRPQVAEAGIAAVHASGYPHISDAKAAPQPSGEGESVFDGPPLDLGLMLKPDTDDVLGEMLDEPTRAPEGRAITKEEEALVEHCLINPKQWGIIAALAKDVAATRPKASEQGGGK
jgi:hypothetical protein